MAEKTKQPSVKKAAQKTVKKTVTKEAGQVATKATAKEKGVKTAVPKATQEVAPKAPPKNKATPRQKPAAKPTAETAQPQPAAPAPAAVVPVVIAPAAPLPAAPRFVKPNWQKRSAAVFGSGFTGSFGVSPPPVPGIRPAHAVVPSFAAKPAVPPTSAPNTHPTAAAPRRSETFQRQEAVAPKPQAQAPTQRPAQTPTQAPNTFKQKRAEKLAQRHARQAAEAPDGDQANGQASGYIGKPQANTQADAPAPAAPSKPAPPAEPLETFTGILEFGRKEKSEGRLRQLDGTYIASPQDPVVGTHLIEKYNLRPGLRLTVALGKPFGGGGPPPHAHKPHGHWGKKDKFKGGRDILRIDPLAKRVHDILSVEGLPPATWANGRNFDELTIVMPEPRLTLEYPGCPPACRFIDLFCPIGKGTRGMIVSPPKAGKTTLLQQIATALHKNHPHVEVFALLIDERPEEVTDFRRNVPVTVWASSNDHPPEKHVGLAIAAIERCKRLAEMGKDVVVLLDSLTRLGRAFNVAPNIIGTGKTLSGGLDAGALGVPKQLFGAARRFEEGGSLTIIATALVDTGSRGDQVIFEEFKGTGNMELILDRRIAEQRLFPAMDLAASGTRNDQKLMSKHELDTVTALRRRLLAMPPPQQMEQLLKAVERYKTNGDLVGDPNSMAKG